MNIEEVEIDLIHYVHSFVHSFIHSSMGCILRGWPDTEMIPALFRCPCCLERRAGPWNISLGRDKSEGQAFCMWKTTFMDWQHTLKVIKGQNLVLTLKNNLVTSQADVSRYNISSFIIFKLIFDVNNCSHSSLKHITDFVFSPLYIAVSILFLTPWIFDESTFCTHHLRTWSTMRLYWRMNHFMK